MLRKIVVVQCCYRDLVTYIQERTPGVGMEESETAGVEGGGGGEGGEGAAQQEDILAKIAEIEAKINTACQEEDYDLAGIAYNSRTTII